MPVPVDQRVAVHDLEAYQGSSWAETVTYYEDEAQESPVDLTDYTAALRVRQERDSPGSILIHLTQGSGITLGGAAGTIVIAFTAAQTGGLLPGNYQYDLFLTPSGEDPEAIMTGTLYVRQRVSA